jgi:hypothetical protein
MKLNIMVTYYNTKDLVSFGNFLLSEERRQHKINSRDESIRQGLNPIPIEDMMAMVSDADLANWRFEEGLKKSKNFLETLGVDMNKVRFCTAPDFFFQESTGQMTHDYGDDTGFRPIKIESWRNLSTVDLKQQCEEKDWAIFYITDDSRLMTNEMGVIPSLRCTFFNNQLGYNTREDFEELISNERFIVIPLDFVWHGLIRNPNFIDDINDLIDQTCLANDWIRADEHHQVLMADKGIPPKASFKIR